MKIFKTSFFKRYWKFLLWGYSFRSRTSIFFLFKISQQIRMLEVSKFLAKMSHGWQAVWVMTYMVTSLKDFSVSLWSGYLRIFQTSKKSTFMISKDYNSSACGGQIWNNSQNYFRRGFSCGLYVRYQSFRDLICLPDPICVFSWEDNF